MTTLQNISYDKDALQKIIIEAKENKRFVFHIRKILREMIEEYTANTAANDDTDDTDDDTDDDLDNYIETKLDEILTLRQQLKNAIVLLEVVSSRILETASTNLDGTENPDWVTQYVREKIMLWLDSPECFDDLWLVQSDTSNFFVDPTINQLIENSEKYEYKPYIVLTKYNGKIIIEEEKEVEIKGISKMVPSWRSTEIIACCISRDYESLETNGENLQKYVNFITKAGSIYHCSSESVKDPKKLMKKIRIIKDI